MLKSSFFIHSRVLVIRLLITCVPSIKLKTFSVLHIKDNKKLKHTTKY